MCCLHHVVEADVGSHHVCCTADDLEGEMVLGAALLVPTLVPGQLLACEGGAELQAMVLALRRDTSCVPQGLSRAVTGAQWPTKGATPGPASCLKEAGPGTWTSFLFKVYGAEAWGGVGRTGWGAGCCSGCELQDSTAGATGTAEGGVPGNVRSWHWFKAGPLRLFCLELPRSWPG